MGIFSKLTAGFLVGFGGLVTIALIFALLDPNSSSDDRDGAIAALLIFSLPMLVIGSGMFWHGRQRHQRSRREHLRATFFRLLQESNGRITPLRFSMESGLDGADAKVYLDDRAKEFNAAYNVTEDGNVIYSFELGESPK